MSRQVLIDTSPIVAILSSQDTYHQVCVDALKRLNPPLITCWAVLTEAFWLLRPDKKAIASLFTMIEGNLLQIHDLPPDSIIWLKNYHLKYYDMGTQIADISLCYLAETLNINTIFTLDRRDFQIYKINKNQSFTIIP